MPEIFVVIALLLSGIAALLHFAAERKLLNFVDYGPGQAVARINRYAAARLLLPVCVNLGCAYLAAMRPGLAVPLLFLTPLSILGAVVWIAAGIGRSKLV
jgi:hypothetical protein